MNLELIWRELSTFAVLGSGGRQWQLAKQDPLEAASSLSSLLNEIAQRDDVAQEQKILQAAGVAAWAKQVAQRAPQDHLALPPASSENVGHPASPNLAACLSRILQEDLQACLPLWLQAASQRSISAPAICLPRLLDLGRQNVLLRPMLAHVLDQRGRWLAQMQSNWKWLLQDVSGEQVQERWWQEGNLEQRIAFLQAQRAQDAAQAREMLQLALPSEKASTRASLLVCLAVNLSQDDEALLEALLDDKAKAVRQAAQQLLARLPKSRWRQRMRARAHACVQWRAAAPAASAASASGWLERMTQGVKSLVGVAGESNMSAAPQLFVELPQQYDAQMQRDGIDEKPPMGVGERGWWLQQILASLPLQEWSEPVNAVADVQPISISQYLHSFQHHDWQDVLFTASEQACILHQDAELARQLLQQGQPFSLPLFRLLERPARLQILYETLQQLQTEPLRIREQLPRYQDLLDTPEVQLDEKMTRQLLATLHAGVMVSEIEHDSHALRHWLLQVVVKLDLQALQQWWSMLDEWERSRYATYGTHFLPEKLDQIIAFRLAMQSAFLAWDQLNQPTENTL